jgi:anti-anti-sigma factor
MEGVSPEPEMTFEVHLSEDGTATVVVRGDLDIANVDRLDAAVAPIIRRGPKRLLVDVGGLRFADSSAIAVWVRWAAIAGGIELHHPSPLLRQVITKMGLAEKLGLER